jgi:hypothetical protein
MSTEADIAARAIEEALFRERGPEPAITEPKRFERRHTMSLPIPDSAAERAAAQAEYDRRAARVKEIGTAAWSEPAHSPVETLDDVLLGKNAIHGDFTEDARTAQALKCVMREGKNWNDMPPFMREALENMQTKVARILAGDFSYPDHWKDLQGYPRLVETRLETK